MNYLRFATFLFGFLLVIVLPILSEKAIANPLPNGSIDGGSPVLKNERPEFDFQPRVGMVQTLTCTNPNCLAQCRGRGYRRGSCQIGRCFCSYV